MSYKLEHCDQKEIESLLLGQQIVDVDLSRDSMTLSNGVKIDVLPNEGCGGCSNGWYHVEDMNKCEAVITSVRFEEVEIEGECAYAYRVFVLAADKEQIALSVEGDDGNGYYGTGYSLLVTVPNDKEHV